MAEQPTDTSADVLALERAVAGRYVLERELGRGGMGVVLLARDLSLDRLVALKLLPTLLAAQPVLRERFLREARTAAGLSHPHIVPIHAVEEHEGIVFIAMAFVDGETLADRVRRTGPLPPHEVARILREVAWALAYAHGRGIVHRDIKPDNILMERGSGRAMVTDFGIARPVERSASTDRLTLEGQLLGTAAFMSPEQAAGEPVDGRSDLYSLGGVGFYSLSGRAPFEARTVEALLVARFTHAAPPVTSARPDAPAALAAVIDRCLMRQPYDRYPTAEAVAEALSESAAGVAATDIAPPVRSFIHAAEQTVWLVFLIIVFSILFGLPTTRRVIPLLIFAAFGVAVVSIDLVRRARELVREGFVAADVRRAFEIQRRAYAEELRQLYDARRTAARRRTRRRAWIALGVGVAARIAMQVFLIPDGRGERISPWMIVSLVLMDIVNTVSFVIAINASPKAERRAFRMAAWVWRRRFTNVYFYIASIGLGRLTAIRPAVDRAAPVARLVELIPVEVNTRFPELPSLIEGLERDQASLRLRESELGRALSEAGTEGARTEAAARSVSAASADGASTITEHALLDRRSALLAEMREALDEVRARRTAIGAALENVRIQLLRLGAGVGRADDMREEVAAMRLLGDNGRAAGDATSLRAPQPLPVR